MKYNMCWDITPKCNESCKFCYRNKIKKELNIEDNRKILKSIYDSGIINKITICGGEPLMYKGLFDMLNKVKKPENVSLSIVTNAIKIADYDKLSSRFNINEEILNNLLKFFKWICFSLDAVSQEIETLVTRNEYHVDRVRYILDYLQENYPNTNIKINSIITKQNYRDIPNIYEFISKYKIVKRWKLFRYLGNTNPQSINEYFDIDDEQFSKVTDFINGLDNSKIKINVNNVDTYDGTYIMLKQDGTVEISENGTLKEVLDLKKDDISKILDIDIFKKEKHLSTHGVAY